jgi:hypothetical protein
VDVIKWAKMDRTCYEERKLLNCKKNNACKPGRGKEERKTKNEINGWCGEGFEGLECG